MVAGSQRCHQRRGPVTPAASKAMSSSPCPSEFSGGGVVLEARKLLSFQAYNPLTGLAYIPPGQSGPIITLNTGQQCVLPQGSRAYIIKGAFGEVCGQNNAASVSIDLGCPDVAVGLTHVPGGDGDTTCTTVGGQSCRMNVNPNEDYYFYFNVSDQFAYNGSRPDVYVMFDYYDSGSGTISLQYDSVAGFGQPAGDATHYKSAGSVTLTGDNTWKHATLHITDAGFSNGQNGPADFRFGKVGGTFYLDKVSVTTSLPVLPVITDITPNPRDPALRRSLQSAVGAYPEQPLASLCGRRQPAARSAGERLRSGQWLDAHCAGHLHHPGPGDQYGRSRHDELERAGSLIERFRLRRRCGSGRLRHTAGLSIGHACGSGLRPGRSEFGWLCRRP